MPETILIIDQDPAQSRMTQHAIGPQLGYSLLCAREEKEAFAHLRPGGGMPDLVLLDLSQPSHLTLNLLREIKNYYPWLPLIAFTRYGDDSHAAHAIQAGADDFLTKPVSLERLRTSLVNALRIKRLSETLKRMQQLEGQGSGDLIPLAMPSLVQGNGKLKKLKSIEREVICFALRHARGCMTQAARDLGIGRSTLYRRVHDLALEGYISRANQTTRPMISVSSGDRS